MLDSGFPPAFFVTGTDTDVGKTIVSALLTIALDGYYWKPIQSGRDDRGLTDRDRVGQLTGLGPERLLPERYCLGQPLSPHLAARLDGVEIELTDFELPVGLDRPLIVEGAGGLLVPINDRHLMIDLIGHLGLPVVVVARSGLGTINHTLLSIGALRRSGIPILGVILNGPLNPENRRAIEFYGQVSVIAEVEPIPLGGHFVNGDLSPEGLRRAAEAVVGQ
jgi:dethiobiotin synthetase